MKVSVATIAALALSTHSAAAWSVNVGRNTARYSLSQRSRAAAALFSYSTEQSGETGTDTFRLNFKGEVSS